MIQFDPEDFSKAAVAARRSKADWAAMQLIAQMDIKKYEVSDNDVLYFLQLWGFEQNHYRTSVMQPGQTWVHSDTLGLIRFASVEIAPPFHGIPVLYHGVGSMDEGQDALQLRLHFD